MTTEKINEILNAAEEIAFIKELLEAAKEAKNERAEKILNRLLNRIL